MTEGFDLTPEQVRVRKKEYIKRFRHKRKEVQRGIRTRYFAWVFPTIGDPIRIGPYKSERITTLRYYEKLLDLAVEGLASEDDVRALRKFEQERCAGVV